MTDLFDWVGPSVPDAWGSVPLRRPDPYGSHLRPLYNLHEDVAVGADMAAAEPADGRWEVFWRELARSLGERGVERFTLVAADGQQLTGCVRFLPKALTRPRFGAWSVEQHRRDLGADVLWIGAAATDLPAGEEGLPARLLIHVIDHARRRGCRRIQALGWGNLPVYALWGQAFPRSVYEAVGFRPIAEVDGSPLRALPDMIAGRHGALVQDLVERQLRSTGLTPAGAESFAVMQLDLR